MIKEEPAQLTEYKDKLRGIAKSSDEISGILKGEGSFHDNLEDYYEISLETKPRSFLKLRLKECRKWEWNDGNVYYGRFPYLYEALSVFMTPPLPALPEVNFQEVQNDYQAMISNKKLSRLNWLARAEILAAFSGVGMVALGKPIAGWALLAGGMISYYFTGKSAPIEHTRSGRLEGFVRLHEAALDADRFVKEHILPHTSH